MARKTSQKRYIPNGPFATRLNGVRYVFHPDHVDAKSGMPGYDKLPKALSKQMRDSFKVIEVPGPVEQASAAPGETRTASRRAKAEDDGPEAVDDGDDV